MTSEYLTMLFRIDLFAAVSLCVSGILLAFLLLVAIATWGRAFFSALTAEVLVELRNARFGKLSEEEARRLEQLKQVYRLRAARGARDMAHWLAVTQDITRDLDHTSFEKKSIGAALGREIARRFNSVPNKTDEDRIVRRKIVNGVRRIARRET